MKPLDGRCFAAPPLSCDAGPKHHSHLYFIEVGVCLSISADMSNSDDVTIYERAFTQWHSSSPCLAGSGLRSWPAPFGSSVTPQHQAGD